MINLLTSDQLNQLLQNGCDENRNKDNYPVVKLKIPQINSTWLLIDIDPDDSDFAFSLYDPGNAFPEFKYLSLPLLKKAADTLNWEIKQDELFQAKYPVSVYAKAARQCGFITEDQEILASIAETQKDRLITSAMLIEEMDIQPALKVLIIEKKQITEKGSNIDPLLYIHTKNANLLQTRDEQSFLPF